MELTREILDDVLGVFGKDLRDSMNKRFDEIDKRFDRLEGEFRELRKTLMIHDAKVESHDRKFKEIGKIAVG